MPATISGCLTLAICILQPHITRAIPEFDIFKIERVNVLTDAIAR